MRLSERPVIQALSLILSSSFRTDRPRTIGALLLYPISFLEAPLVAFGLKLATNATFSGDIASLLAAVALIASAGAIINIVDLKAWQLCLDLEDRVGAALELRAIELVSRLPGIEHFERPEVLDRLEILRERGWMLGRAMYVLPMNIADLVRALATLGLLASVHPALLLLPLFAIPSILIDAESEKRAQRAEEEASSSVRAARHLYELGTSPGPGKELRIFGLTREIFARHRSIRLEIHRVKSGIEWNNALRSILGTLVFALGFAAAAVFVGYRVASGESSPGDLVLALALAASINNEARVASELGSWARWVMRIAGNLLWLEKLSSEGRGGASSEAVDGAIAPGVALPSRLSVGLSIEGLSFSYPGTERLILSDIDCELPAGSAVALVGENGAGKTSLVKLLCGFYKPSSGRILMDGIDLGSLDPDVWRARVSAVFQDFARFQFTLREDVGIGNLPSIEDPERVLEALDRANAAELPASLPSGLETRLGRLWPEAQELSLGQWQKLALARGLMRSSPLLFVLDEPTASLDPQTEAALFERQLGAPGGGAVKLFVTHRFATVAKVDLILVLKDGRIVERGTHDELLREGGEYQRLYRLQAGLFKARTRRE